MAGAKWFSCHELQTDKNFCQLVFQEDTVLIRVKVKYTACRKVEETRTRNSLDSRAELQQHKSTSTIMCTVFEYLYTSHK